MKRWDICQLADQCIGHVDAVGEHYYDTDSLNNLDELEALLISLVTSLCTNCANDGKEASVRKINEKSVQILKNIRNQIEDYLIDCAE